jgi:hypothetical protein
MMSREICRLLTSRTPQCPKPEAGDWLQGEVAVLG